MRRRFFPLLLPLALGASAALGKVRVVATVPDLAAAAEAIGGPLVTATSLATGREDPHRLTVTVEQVRQVAAADVLCEVGLDLEAGYLPALVARAGNRALAPGGKGQCVVGNEVPLVDRSFAPVDPAESVHPYGNPHVWLGPSALAHGAHAIEAALARVDPAHRLDYEKGLQRYQESLARLEAELSARLAPIRAAQTRAGHPLLAEYHREFLYFFRSYGLTSWGSLEPEPGALPAARHLAVTAQAARRDGVRAILAAAYDPPAVLARFHELSGIPVVVVPTSSEPGQRTYEATQRQIADALLKALATP